MDTLNGHNDVSSTILDVVSPYLERSLTRPSSQTALLMPIIQYVLPSRNKRVKEIFHLC
jgi:hypothetical protein